MIEWRVLVKVPYNDTFAWIRDRRTVMCDFEVFYVALYKRGSPQSLFAGPFTHWEEAETKREELEASSRNRFVTLSSLVHCAGGDEE